MVSLALMAFSQTLLWGLTIGLVGVLLPYQWLLWIATNIKCLSSGGADNCNR